MPGAPTTSSLREGLVLPLQPPDLTQELLSTALLVAPLRLAGREEGAAVFAMQTGSAELVRRSQQRLDQAVRRGDFGQSPVRALWVAELLRHQQVLAELLAVGRVVPAPAAVVELACHRMDVCCSH